MLEHIDEDVLTMAARIQTLAIEITHPAALKGYDLPRSIRMGLNNGSPQCHIDALVAFIANRQ